MAFESELKPRPGMVWVVKRPFLYKDPTRDSPVFSLRNSEWSLSISCLKNKVSVEMYFKICLVNKSGLKKFQPFHVTTYLEDSRCSEPISPQIVLLTSTGQAVWYLKYSDLLREIPSFHTHGVFTIVCAFDTSVGANASRSTITGEQTESGEKRKSPGLLFSFISSIWHLIMPYWKFREFEKHRPEYSDVPEHKKIRLSLDSEPMLDCVPFADDQSRLSQRLYLDFPLNMQSLSQDLGSLLDRHILPDVTLKTGEHTIPVHKAVLAARSEVFLAMFQNKMSERKSGVVDIKDVEPPVLEALLKYIYSGKIVIEGLSEDMVFKLYSASDKYAICSLTKICSEFITENLREENFLQALVLADAHSDKELKEAVVCFITENDVLLSSDGWFTFSKEYPKVALEVYRMWFKKSVLNRKESTKSNFIIIE